MSASAHPDVMDKLVSLCKRRGFIFQSSEIYGGTGSVWDYGPLGVELKKNLKDRWWNAMVRARDDIEGLDAAILMHPRTWEASGPRGRLRRSAGGLQDVQGPLPRRQARRRALPAEAEQAAGRSTTHCQLTEPRSFNLMFKTFMGAASRRARPIVYLRPETAQGIFVNFLNVQQATRQKVPFGIAQIGKAFRNEITPGNFIFRTREFEQMEMQFFVEPGTDMEWFEQLEGRSAWSGTSRSGSRRERLQVPPAHAERARALRARGVRHRRSTSAARSASRRSRACTTAATSTSRSTSSSRGKKLEYFDQLNNKRYVPYVIETSVGADRVTLAALVNAYREEAVAGEDEGRVVLGLHPALAPDQGRRSSRSRRRTASRRWRDASRTTCARTFHGGLRRDRVASASATAGRTRSARRSASRSTASRRTTRP